MSQDQGIVTLTKCFEELHDPRMERTRLHLLIDIVVLALLGTIAGCDSWEDLPRFGKAKLEWLKTLLELPNGIPSADTFARVFQRLNPDEFLKCMDSWINTFRCPSGESLVAIDGKTMRGSGDGDFKGCPPIHMVRAWASENQLVLGQVACEAKSNEITAIPQLLKLINIQGAIVTIDAMGCQTEIAAEIRNGKADYVLAAKDNQPKLNQEIGDSFEAELQREAEGVKPTFRHYQTEEVGHGRNETRDYYIMPVPKGFTQAGRWQDLTSLGMVIRHRVIQGKEEASIQYYICSIAPTVNRFARATRGHWSIENSLHWMLDVNFAEDDSQIRKGYSPQIASMLRQLALLILKTDTHLKSSIRGKRKIVAWNNEALLKLLLNSNVL
jgi:predicted transposase YbfD/YdcC